RDRKMARQYNQRAVSSAPDAPTREPTTSQAWMLRVAILVALGISFALVDARTHDPRPLSESFFGTFSCAAYASVAAHYATRRGLPQRTVLCFVLWVVIAFAMAQFSGLRLPSICRAALAGLGLGALIAYFAAAIRAGSSANRQSVVADVAEALVVPLGVIQ